MCNFRFMFHIKLNTSHNVIQNEYPGTRRRKNKKNNIISSFVKFNSVFMYLKIIKNFKNMFESFSSKHIVP